MPPKESESLAFLKVGEAVSQGLYYGSKSILDKLAEEVKAWNLLWETLGPMLDRLEKDPRTPKLVHLVKHGKNRRIRKKNAKRLVRIMKGE